MVYGLSEITIFFKYFRYILVHPTSLTKFSILIINLNGFDVSVYSLHNIYLQIHIIR